MEGIRGSDEKGSDNDESLTSGSNGKKRKSSGAEKGNSTSERADKGHDNNDKVGPRKSKKVRDEVEDLHTETQRLLRETPGTSFAPEQATKKPVSSLIEKIRQRKLQLTHNVQMPSTLGSALKICTLERKDVPSEGTDDDEIEFVMSKSSTRLVVKQELGEPSTYGIPRDETYENLRAMDDTNQGGEGVCSQPSTPDIRLDSSPQDCGCKSQPKSVCRAPLLESQDLYSDSQLSAYKDESPARGDDEDVAPAARPRLNLQLDYETQDDDRWLEEDNEKENKVPTRVSPLVHIPIVSDVRGLVDDEAEDEDEDDDLEDEGDEGDEDEVAAGELQDLLTQDAGEKPAEIERRVGLHAKWLEQQDLAMEDNILHRLESGWRNKGKKDMPALLSDALGIASKGNVVARPFGGIDTLAESRSGGFVSPLEVLRKQVKDDIGPLRRATSSGSLDLDRADGTHQDDYREYSDDEEAEENLRRQLFLQESEEKTEFLSVTEDESSREIFRLINKVNVSTVKPRTSTGHNEARSGGTGYHQPPSLQHQSSFLRRKATNTAVTTKHGSGNSRSYVFGRDDSNSRDTSRLDSKDQAGKAKARDEQKINSTTQLTRKDASSGSKSSLPQEIKPCGPSLFQVLKRQAAELASGKTPLDLNGSSSRGDNLSIFLAIKPSRQPRSSRGT